MAGIITRKRLLIAAAVAALTVVVGFLINRRIKNGRFHELCMIGTAEQVMEAIRDGADAFAIDDNGWTSLMWAAGNNRNTDIILVLTGIGLDVNRKAVKNGWTPLMLAAQFNPNPEMIKELASVGADPNLTDFNGWTALMLAAWRTTNPEVINALLDIGADKTVADRMGMTAFDIAQSNPNLKNVRALRSKGNSKSKGRVR